MRSFRVLPALALLTLVLVACGEDQPPTAPAESEAVLEPAAAAAAGLRVVNSPADPGDGTCDARQCTLREAIKDPGSTQIRFATGFTGPITLARAGAGGGTLMVGKPLTITGPRAGVVIRRPTTDPAFRIFRIDSGTTVALSNLTLRDGKAERQAGGILNFGTLTLTKVKIQNSAPDGIVNRGVLTLANSAVTGSAVHGITSYDATLTLTNSTVSGNGWNGITDHAGTLTIADGVVSSNAHAGISQDWGRSTLDRVRIVGNSTGGIGIWHTWMTVTNSTIARNSGGGIGIGRGGLTVSNSTLVNNTTTDNGGGISCSTAPRTGVAVRITNSTISGNSAAYGGGIFCEDNIYGMSQVSLINTTVVFNSATVAGGGLAQWGEEDANISLSNSLVALNTAPKGPDIEGPGENEYEQVDASFSLIGDGTGSGLTNNGGNQVGNVAPYTAPIDPLLGGLLNNGGLTRTHALLAGSPAIDAASSAECPASDQRGVSRPQGEGCDIGSYERK